jgi:hypothetical protein
VELSDFYRDLDQLTLVRVQIFDEQKPADGPCVSVGRGDIGKSTALRLVLNNKAVKRFDGGSYASITRLVAEQPSEEFLESWPLWQRRPLQPQEALKDMTLEVDDASPDSTLGVILLLARLAEGSVALRSARVKVGDTVSRPAGRIVELRTDLSRRPLRIMCISSTPPKMIRAQRKSLKPCIGRVMRLTARWSCSTMLLRYLHCRITTLVPCFLL